MESSPVRRAPHNWEVGEAEGSSAADRGGQALAERSGGTAAGTPVRDGSRYSESCGRQAIDGEAKRA